MSFLSIIFSLKLCESCYIWFLWFLVFKNFFHIDPQGNKTLSQTFRLAQRRKSNDDILSASVQEELKSCHQRAHSSSVKNLPSSGQRPTSWSTPTSPYYQGSRNLFVRITSPVVCAKLQTFPKAKMRLPPKVSFIINIEISSILKWLKIEDTF